MRFERWAFLRVAVLALAFSLFALLAACSSSGSDDTPEPGQSPNAEESPVDTGGDGGDDPGGATDAQALFEALQGQPLPADTLPAELSGQSWVANNPSGGKQWDPDGINFLVFSVQPSEDEVVVINLFVDSTSEQAAERITAKFYLEGFQGGDPSTEAAVDIGGRDGSCLEGTSAAGRGFMQCQARQDNVIVVDYSQLVRFTGDSSNANVAVDIADLVLDFVDSLR